MLKNDIITRTNHLGEGDFTIKELFDPQEWSNYSVDERRGVGRWAYNRIKRGVWNRNGWIIEPLNNTNPQRYRKRRQTLSPTSVERISSNEIPNVEQIVFKDLIKIPGETGKWLEIKISLFENKNVA
jgi:hypothetical protein